MHEGQPAQRGGGRKSGQVAHHAAAQRDHRGAPFHPRFQQRIGDMAKHRQALAGLARRHHHLPQFEARFGQSSDQRRQMQLRDDLVGNDHGAFLRQYIGQMGAGASDQAIADQHFVRS